MVKWRKNEILRRDRVKHSKKKKRQGGKSAEQLGHYGSCDQTLVVVAHVLC